MIFTISRVSLYDDADEENCPHKDAYFVNKYPVNDVSYHKCRGESDFMQWKSYGTEHSIDADGFMHKIIHMPKWCIDIPTLDALMQFIKDLDCTKIIVDKDNHITIYDSYIE